LKNKPGRIESRQILCNLGVFSLAKSRRSIIPFFNYVTALFYVLKIVICTDLICIAGGVGIQPLHSAPSHTVPTSAPQMQVQAVHVVNVVMVGPKPINTTCPNCRAEIKTTTVTTPRALAHLGCLALCLTG